MVMEPQLQAWQTWLEQLFQFAQLPVQIRLDRREVLSLGSSASATSEKEPDEDWLIIDTASLTSEQMSNLMAEDGDFLNAIQYLGSTLLNLDQPESEQRVYTIEMGGYRENRQQELLRIAEHAVEQVRSTGEEFEIEALSSAERRQVHTFLKACEDLETYSRGREPDRRLVVRSRLA